MFDDISSTREQLLELVRQIAGDQFFNDVRQSHPVYDEITVAGTAYNQTVAAARRLLARLGT